MPECQQTLVEERSPTVEENSPRSLPELVYGVETAVLRPVGRKFRTMKELITYVTCLTTSDWWIESFPKATVGVHVEIRSPSAVFGIATGETIAIPNNPDHRAIVSVLHELAHIATNNGDGHGPLWRAAFIKLVRKEMGFYAAIELEQAYREAFSK